MCFAFISDSFGAQIVGNPILICNNGYTTDRENCDTYSAGSCASGYYTVLADNTSFGALLNSSCQSSERKIVVPENMYPIFSGTLVSGAEVKICDNGYTTDRSSCTNYDTGNNTCRSGYYLVLGDGNSFGPLLDQGCQSTYTRRTRPDNMYPIYTGTVVSGAEIKICDNGYTTDRSSCTTYSQSQCPNNYLDINVNENTFATQTNNTCASGYHSFSAEDTCHWTNSSSYCLNVCGNGSFMTSNDTCAALCGAGITTLRTSTGLILPVWATKQMTPSLNIGLGNDVCYVSLAPGNTNDSALMFDVNGTVYHTVE